MKAIIHYEGTEEERLAAALQDVQAYLGKERYERIMQSFVEAICELSRKEISIWIAFMGIEGFYPENALFYEICRRAENG